MEDENHLGTMYGIIALEPQGQLVAGSITSLTLTYTTGKYGMDDLGGLKILFRFACDQSPLQTSDPKGIGYTSANASNGASVELSYTARENIRPWYKALRVRIAGEGLKQGETITIRLGDTRFGSPGLRLQTFFETSFEFRTEVDVFSTNLYTKIPSPVISLISGEPVKWVAVLPTLRRASDSFSLKIRAEDKWGNPSDKGSDEFFLKSTVPLKNLPSSFKWKKGNVIHVIEKVSLADARGERCVVRIEITDSKGIVLTITNPLVIEPNPPLLHYWGDLHGQSEETLGTNSAEMYFKYARDSAFLDVVGHQGNDFQVTKELWQTINHLSEEFNEFGRFVAISGYEYSANTALGGDRNVYFLNPNSQIHRSSHALVPEENDSDSDCLTVTDLFKALKVDNANAHDSVVVFAHVGGRYADLRNYHDGTLEPSIEIHSAWGTFEWLLHDAFEMGYRVGIVANSDDHKGRPGAAYPGASEFGALGGLTCFLIPDLSRETIFKALKSRHHYATTGARIFLEVQGLLNKDGRLYEKDPSIFPPNENRISTCRTVQMGDIVQVLTTEEKEAKIILKISVEADAPIERVEIFNGLNLMETIRPFLEDNGNLMPPIDVLNRIRVCWEGAESRARKRNTTWKGTAQFVRNRIEKVSSFNFWNIDSPLRQDSTNQLSWNTMTSGNVQGFDVVIADCSLGQLIFKSSQINFEIPISTISKKDVIFEAGGLGKRVKIFRLPVKNPYSSFQIEKEFLLSPSRKQDDRFYVRITLENGHQAWSSPMYLIKE